jgi:2-oxoisovalerate dehydrogenase E1 component alpha subunit
MLLARRLDERAWVLHRQGKIAFHVSGIGHEAAQAAAAMVLRKGHDWVTPYYRDLALMLGLGYTPLDFLLGLLGKRGDPSSGGRQMPSHYSSRALNTVSHSSPVATQATHAAGIGLAIKMRATDQVVFSTIGEGSTSQGEWYEAVNWAAVHSLPVIFCVENNQYAISVPVGRQMAVPSVADRACGLGLEGVSVDGSDPFASWAVLARAVEKARSGGGPTVIEARVARITPHSSDDDDRTYRPREELEQIKREDCLLRTQRCLQEEGLLQEGEAETLDRQARQEVEEALSTALSAPDPDASEAAGPVYAEESRREADEPEPVPAYAGEARNA